MNLNSLMVLLAAVIFITGCDRLPLPEAEKEVNFLVGTWIVDRERTMEHLNETLVGENAEGLASKIAAVAMQKTAEKLISPMDSIKYTFTDTEYSEKVGSYDGRTTTYEIIARPGIDTIKTKDAKGVVNEYHKEGLNIWFNLRGNEKMRVYLRASN